MSKVRAPQVGSRKNLLAGLGVVGEPLGCDGRWDDDHDRDRQQQQCADEGSPPVCGVRSGVGEEQQDDATPASHHADVEHLLSELG